MTAGGEGRQVGPGRLILVVGPSGAGKDTLIRAARARLADRADVLFPRRMITRPPSESEDNEATDPATFARLAAAGGFAISWRAHGLSYGLPAQIDAALASGRRVVCNVSRTVVEALRARYVDVLVIEVTAPVSVLAERLSARGRPQDGALMERLERSNEVEGARPDVTITNAGDVHEALGAFLDAVLTRTSTYASP